MSDAATSRASSMSRLEDRIRRLEDVHQIQQLGVLYMLVMDEHDEEGIRRVFTEDAVVEAEDGSFYGATGVENIVELWRSRFDWLGPEYHVSHGHLVRFDEGDPDVAYGLLAGHAEVGRAGVPMVAALRYRDTYRRDKGVWKFAHRLMGFGYYLPAEEYARDFIAPDSVRLGSDRTAPQWPWVRHGTDSGRDFLRGFY